MSSIECSVAIQTFTNRRRMSKAFPRDVSKLAEKAELNINAKMLRVPFSPGAAFSSLT
jgi:hypothetical protein